MSDHSLSTRSHLAPASLALTLALLVGCGDRAELWRSPLVIDGPHRVGQQLMWVDATRGLVFALDVASTPTVRTVSIRRNATTTLASPNGAELLVVSGGKEARLKGQEPEDAGLSVIRAGASGAPELSRFYPLSGAFDRLAVSRDGKLAVAYYGSAQSGGVFRNPNEVALVDLDRPADAENPLLRTVRSFGSAPLGVVFSPPMRPVGSTPPPAGAQRTLAVVLADNYITLLDLTNPRRKEITVPLAHPEAPGTIKPQQVYFSASTGTIFVRADGASDIYSLTLREKTPDGPTDNDYLPSINQPSAGWPPQDMILFSDGGQDMILTANGTVLAVIDAQTGEFATIAVSEAVDAILAVPAGAPKLALIYSKRTPRARVHFLELKEVRLGLSKNLTSRNLDKPVHQLVAMPDGRQALVVHDDQRTVVSVLDLVGANHTVSPIQGTLALTSFDFLKSGSGTYLVGVSPGLQRVGVLDLANLHPLDLRLDDDPRRVFAVGEALVVDHGALQGLVTVVPGARATREQSHVLWGFFLDGLLDHELKD